MATEPRKVLFLYLELAGYTISCLEQLVREGCEVHVVRWPVNAEAPFQFQNTNGITYYLRNDYSDHQLMDLAEKIAPEAIVCSGWIDKGYTKVCGQFCKRTPTVLALDNHWNGTAKQWAAALLSKVLIRKNFSHVWVPGAPQQIYARKLGFPEHRISTGFYSADYPYFLEQGKQADQKKYEQGPRRFLYLGRYVQHKGIFDLWEAYIRLRKEHNTDWELWCLGTGDQYDARIEHEGIKHFGFVQPADLPAILQQSHAFVLPSHFEPWGVVVHELAAAGFPIISSDKVGAASRFVQSGKNGFVFQHGQVEDLLGAMKKMNDCSMEKLREMGAQSRELAAEVTPDKWANTLLNLNK